MTKHHRSSGKLDYMKLKRSILERYLVNNPIAVNVAPESLLLSDLYQFLKVNNQVNRPLNQLQTIAKSWVYDPDAAGIETNLLLDFMRHPGYYGACNMEWFNSNKTEFLTAPFAVWNEIETGDDFKVGEKYIDGSVNIVKGKNDAFSQSLLEMYRQNNKNMFDGLKSKYGEIKVNGNKIELTENSAGIPAYDPYGVPMGRIAMPLFPMIYDEFLAATDATKCKLDPNAECQYIAGALAYLTKVTSADRVSLNTYLDKVNAKDKTKLIGGGDDVCDHVYNDVRNFQSKLYAHFYGPADKKDETLKQCTEHELTRLIKLISQGKLSEDGMDYIYHYVHYFMNYVCSATDKNDIVTAAADKNIFGDDKTVQDFTKKLLEAVSKKTSDIDFAAKITTLKSGKQLVRRILEKYIGKFDFYELQMDVQDGEKTGKLPKTFIPSDFTELISKIDLIETDSDDAKSMHRIISGITFMQQVYGNYFTGKTTKPKNWEKNIDCIGMTFDFIICRVNVSTGALPVKLYGARRQQT
jgi:hypothetical protein